MRKVVVGRVLIVAALALLASGPVMAQTTSTDYSATSALGVMGNVSVGLLRGVELVGDFGFNHKNESGAGINIATVTGGARYVFAVEPSGTVKPFVEGLVGVGVLNAPDLGTEKGFTWGVGAGTDIMSLKWSGLRVQVNYFRMQLPNSVTLSQIRFGLGLSLGGRVKTAGGWAPARLSATIPNNPV